MTKTLESPLPWAVIEGARKVLNDSWNEEMQCCFPHRYAYPHQWLWDSCFHVVGWAALGDRRAIVELRSSLLAQLRSGFPPHMRYTGPTTSRGPLAGCSSFTQPPIYAHALRLVHEQFGAQADSIDSVGRALTYLYDNRRLDNGLIYIVHPWEAGTDDSPRWDSWVGIDEWDIGRLSEYDTHLVDVTEFDPEGAATWSAEFVACPASFNALTAWAFSEYAAVTGDQVWVARSHDLADAIDRHLWADDTGLWNDLGIVGGGRSCELPTVDGILPALVTRNERYARRALEQLSKADRFSAPFGRRFLPPGHSKFLADIYWRGPAWPQLEYLLWTAASLRGMKDLAADIAGAAIKGVLRAQFAEYWNPLTGQGHGGKPQTWSAVMAAVACCYND